MPPALTAQKPIPRITISVDFLVFLGMSEEKRSQCGDFPIVHSPRVAFARAPTYDTEYLTNIVQPWISTRSEHYHGIFLGNRSTPSRVLWTGLYPRFVRFQVTSKDGVSQHIQYNLDVDAFEEQSV